MQSLEITGRMLDMVRAEAEKLFRGVGQAHGWDHVLRVEAMALGFLDGKGDLPFTSLVAMLHDADDYKLFPAGESGETPNADRIMLLAGIPGGVQDMVRSELGRFGYSKRLLGLAPETNEGRAVSDADMCDIMGATGILRQAEYGFARNAPFFDPDDLPAEAVTHEGYMSTQSESACRHAFDKVLRLPGLMLTEKGRAEAAMRYKTNAMFLEALFRERGADAWQGRLDRFLAGQG